VRLGDRMVVLDQGKVIADGPLAQIVGRPDLPLVSGRSEAGTVLEAAVMAADPARGLTRLRVGAWEIAVPATAAAEGEAVRLFVLARDVMLALDKPLRISARNVLSGVVRALDSQSAGSVLVTIEQAGVRLLASLTPDAVTDLGLQPGTPVWAVLKSVAIEGFGGGLLAALDGEA